MLSVDILMGNGVKGGNVYFSFGDGLENNNVI